MNVTTPGYMNHTSRVSSIALNVAGGNLSNMTFDFGQDGITDSNITGSFTEANGTVIVNLSGADLNNVLNRTAIVGHTQETPLAIYSASAGRLIINGINYTYNPNPIKLNITPIQSYLDNYGNGTTRVNISVEASGTSAKINLTDLKIRYLGGNYTVPITAHSTGYASTITRYITYYHSRWDYNFVPEIDYLLFMPRYPTQKNVTPYGQSNSVPILNITNLGYSGKNATLSIYLDNPLSCVNTTISITNNKSNGFILNNTFQDLKNLTYLQNASIWLWSDYGCNYSYWKNYQPYLYFNQCCEGCICSKEVV